MEKLRKSGSERFSNRLLEKILRLFLVTFIFFSTSAFAITPAEISKITIHPEQNVFFTNQELKYVLEIPGIAPHDVQTQLPENMKEGVNYISSRRMEFFTNDSSTGTRIEFWFSFKDPGTGVIPPLIVRIQGRTYYLNFDKVQLYENPKTIAPRLIVELNSSRFVYPAIDNKKVKEVFNTPVTEPIEIKVYVQFAVQIKQFGFEIPKDSLFEELERYDMVTGKAKYSDFTQEIIPVARFRWTPLKEAKLTLPNIRAVVTAYSGRNLELGLPDCTVVVGKKNSQSAAKDNENGTSSDNSIFSYALSEPVEEEVVNKVRVPVESDFYEIADLRSKERHSFGLSNNARTERKALEQSIGIVVSNDEPSVPFWQMIVVFLVLFIAGAIVFFIFKKKMMALVFLCLSILFSFFTIFMGNRISEKHAIVKGGDISPVPENSALSSTAVTAGTCVRIMQETSDWYYIEYNENGGWMKKTDLIPIE